eukprot:9216174-Pyramimonas_sp.AAC.1
MGPRGRRPGVCWGLLGATGWRFGVDGSKCPFGFPVWALSWGPPWVVWIAFVERYSSLLGRLGTFLRAS